MTDALDATTDSESAPAPLREGSRLTTPGRTVTEADIVSFAAWTGDRNPHHVDEEWAATSRWGGRIAHGMLVLSYAIGLLPQKNVVALRRIRNVVFKRPVRLGDTMHVDGLIANVNPISREYSMVSLQLRVTAREKLCVRGELDLLVKP